MTIQVFGHRIPDTDSTGSAIIWAWYLNEVRGEKAEAVLLGEPNAEATFVLKRWNIPKPAIINDVAPNTPVVIVDTNNPAELPASIGTADIREIIDHHKLVGGLETSLPITVTIRPMACTATIIHDLIGPDMDAAPDWILATMLSCILSDTLEFRSPTTTGHDRKVAERLASRLHLAISDYAAEMFAAKSDVSHLPDMELLRTDSKEYTVNGTKLRISVLETTAPNAVLCRKASLMRNMENVASEDHVDQVLFFVVDILNENATLLVPNNFVKKVAEESFGVTVDGDTVTLPGIMSRKKQIIPNLKV